MMMPTRINDKIPDWLRGEIQMRCRECGADMLIKEQSAVDHEKSKTALQNRIRIIEPQALAALLGALRNGGENNETA